MALEAPVEKSLSTDASRGTRELFPPPLNQPSPLETVIDPEAPPFSNSFSLENFNYLPREETFPTTPSNTTAELFPPSLNQPSPLETAIDPEAPTSFNSFSLENSNYLPREETFPTTSSNTILIQYYLNKKEVRENCLVKMSNIAHRRPKNVV